MCFPTQTIKDQQPDQDQEKKKRRTNARGGLDDGAVVDEGDEGTEAFRAKFVVVVVEVLGGEDDGGGVAEFPPEVETVDDLGGAVEFVVVRALEESHVGSVDHDSTRRRSSESIVNLVQ